MVEGSVAFGIEISILKETFRPGKEDVVGL
jgi:hypothetical protein